MALPSHRVSIFKRFQNEQWSNDWLINATTMDAANDIGDALAAFERNFHHEHISIEYMRISTTAKLDRIFRHVPINQQGIMDNAGKEFLPLFCTVRLDMSTLDSDPCRKYFRMPVAEDWQNEGRLSPALLTDLNGIITTHLLNTIALDNIVSGKGHVVNGADVYQFVQMRQLNRRKRPKVKVVVLP